MRSRVRGAALIWGVMHSRLAALLLAMFTPLAAGAAGWSATARTDVRAIYDRNVFLQEEVPLMSGQTVRGTPACAADIELVAGASATVSHKAAASGSVAAELSYAFEWHDFDSYHGESHRDHRLVAGVQATPGAWEYEGKINVFHVDGSADSPVYNGMGGVPALGGEPVRSRRAQTVVNASASALWHDAGALRLRGTASVLNQDFHTRHAAGPMGYANYVDRGQLLAGVDAGRALSSNVTAWASLRAGRQWQANLLGRPENFSNTLVRPLLGLEGRITPTLRVSAWAGPDYRRFTGERRAGTDAARTLPFFDVAAAWKPTPDDSVTLSGRQQLWLGSGGRSAYREIKADAAWNHRFSTTTDAGLRFGVLHGNFAGYTAAARHETVFVAGAMLGRALTHRLRIEMAVTREWAETEVAATPARAYVRWLGAVGATLTW